jgi:isopenicillin N synthase-like dioxygenase
MLKTISLLSPQLGAEIVDALLTDGFFLLSDHGVPLERITATAKAFFSDDAAKKAILMAQYRGYSALGSEVTKYEGGVRKRDWHDGYDYIPETTDPKWAGKNQFPSAEFRVVVEEYVRRSNEVGFRVVRAIEAALGLAEGRVVSGEPFSLLRLLHYPPLGEGESEENTDLDVGLGIGEVRQL